MAGHLFQLDAELFSKDTLSLRCDRDRTCLFDAAYPALPQTVGTKGCPDSAGDVRAPFTPVETGST
jgi:hypothetical protein